MKQSRQSRSSSKAQRSRSGKPDTDTSNKATTREFEREDMGIAPKE